MKNTKLVLRFVLIILSVTGISLTAQNNALHFDGTDDFVSITGISPAISGSGSFEFWIKLDQIPTTNARILSSKWSASGYEIIIDANVGTINTEGSFVNGEDLESTNALSVGVWTHVAITANSSGSSLYINGILEDTGGAATFSIEESQIGGMWTDGFYECVPGYIDEVRFWSDVRSQSEIRSNMYNELTVIEDDGLVAYYKFNETTGTSADNFEGTSGLDGILSGMVGNEWATSSVFFGPKNCLDFDGIDDNVWCSSFSPTVTQGTIEFWINLDGLPDDNARIISNGPNYSTGDEIYLSSSEGKIKTFGSFVSGDDIESTDALAIGVWTHVAITADGSGSELYINGLLDDTGGAAAFSYSSFRIGGQYTSSIWETFDGKIDEVRVWSDIRTEAEIRENMCKTLVGNEFGLVAYYNFDNTIGAVLQSFPAIGNDGVLEGMTNDDWVASNAFNTWLNTDNSTWSTASNWSSGVPISTDNVGIFDYTGGVAPVLSGTPLINNLVVGTTSDLTLGSNVTVNRNLFLFDDLNLNGKTVILGSTGYLYEINGNITGTTGTIQTTRNLDNIDENVAGLGAEITSTTNMGLTTIVRGHTAQGSQGIERYYRITPTINTELNATLVFNYLDSELNGVTENDLKLFKAPDGLFWIVQSSSVVNSLDNTLSLSGIESFSSWTAGDLEGLPVILSALTVRYTSNTPVLSWTTQSEENNAYWNVYRSISQNLGQAIQLNTNEFIEGAGSTSEPTNYTFTDAYGVEENQTYYYWIESVANSGETEYYGSISLYIPFSGSTNGIPEPPDIYGLHQNYPNPFNPSTLISFTLQEDSDVKLTIYNIKGEKIKTIMNEHVYADQNIRKVWDGTDRTGKRVSSGVYIYKLATNSKDYSKKMIMVE